MERPACLEPRKDIIVEGDAYIALTQEPWLAIQAASLFGRTRFIEIVYRAETAAAPVRPLLRFWLGAEKYQDHILPAPVQGAAKWIGRVPRECTEIWISPTNRIGPFRFWVSEPRPAPRLSLLRRLFQSPKRAFFALAAGWVKLTDEATLNWRWALGSSPLRSVDLVAPAAPGFYISVKEPPSGRDCFKILIDVTGASAAQIDMTCASVESQSWKKRRAYLLGESLDSAAAARKSIWDAKPDFEGTAQTSFHANGFILCLNAGDVLVEHALSSFAAHFAARPEHRCAYADEIRQGDDGEEIPVFKPGWSPTLQEGARYVGRAAAFRASLLDDEANWPSLKAEEIVNRIVARLSPNEVGAVRSLLFKLQSRISHYLPTRDAVHCTTRPAVSIVIPTRDKADLLRACVGSLFEKTTYSNFDVLIIDNDSVEPGTLQLMNELSVKYDRVKIIRVPGSFNFSALSNAGAEASTGEYLLFLNNDTQIVTPDWIERLLYFATRSDIGAVGAKLLYPNRKVQHVGVLLGMGGVAGHFGAGLDENAPGWMGRNLAPHEVSAVTGACLMVARKKFDAVGRFDEENLPVDLNDVDLCLRLGERGWRTICHSQVVLIHHQSASRGGGLRLQQVYERERRFFVERWRAVIRDDPYFHPALSLYAYTEMLP
ncbi:glycosyltransferase family 2 protein [Methylocystis parvus]|uniref:glycosyltransferase family 2 protein n=1 Tax=Methylocystis parvus TaxID=134 RepID=UPI003C71BF29